MRERANNTKLTARTPVAFKEAVEDLRTLLQRERRWFYCGEKISLEAIINVAVMEFLKADPTARARVLERHIPEIERLFEEEEARANPAEGGAGDVEGGLKSGGQIRKRQPRKDRGSA